MVEMILIMLALVMLVYMITQADMKITINVNHNKTNEVEATTSASIADDDELTQGELDKYYEENKVPTFDDVIKVINEEFGGINYED